MRGGGKGTGGGGVEGGDEEGDLGGEGGARVQVQASVRNVTQGGRLAASQPRRQITGGQSRGHDGDGDAGNFFQGQ